MKALLCVVLASMVLLVGCTSWESATRTGCVLMTKRVNNRITDESVKLTDAQCEAFGGAFFDQAQEDYKTLEDWIGSIGD